MVERTAVQVFGLAFAAGKEICEKTAKEATERLEAEAYTSAQAQSTTTTGKRPVEETIKIYTRKLAELAVGFVKGYTSTEKERENPEDPPGLFDLSGGARGFLSGADAERMFAPLMTTHVGVHTVVLSTKSFGVDAADVAYKALGNVKDTLRIANLSDIIGGRPEHEALQVLEKLSTALMQATLKEVDLSNNALGEKGLRACTCLFSSQPELEVLSLHNVGCSPDACVALNELTKGMKLTALFLYNNMSGDEGGKAIGDLLSRMPNVTRFQMASSRVGSDGVLDLTTGLTAATGLTSLDLNDNPATEECIPGVVKLLQCQAKLQRLNLSDTSLGDQGVTELSTALCTAVPVLEELELALNEITFEGAKALGRAVSTKKSLRKLDLHENELEDRGIMVVSKSISSTTSLEELNVNGNMVHRVGAVCVVKALKGKKQFKKLLIDENQISAEGIEEMKRIVAGLFGDAAVLGPLDENEEEEEEEDNENELVQIDVGQTTLDALVDALSSISLND